MPEFALNRVGGWNFVCMSCFYSMCSQLLSNVAKYCHRVLHG